MGAVSFGRRNRIRFTEGGSLKSWQPTVGAAVYAVTYRNDPAGKPKAHSVIYFGETADLTKQFPLIREKIDNWWENNGGMGSDLYVFYHEMPGSSQQERANIQHQLVVEYDPRGNT